MKKVIITTVILLAIALSSCTTLLAPSFAENNDVLIDVYDKTYCIRLEDIGLGNLLILGTSTNEPESKKINSVKMLEWCLNESMLGDSYTGYFVTYEVLLDEGRWYTLIDLTEFDSDRYEWKVIDADQSLSTIQSMLY